MIIDSAQGNINTIHLSKIQSETSTDIYIAKGAHFTDFLLRENDLFYGIDNKITKPIIARNLNANFVLTQNITGTTDDKRIHAYHRECNSTRIVLLDSVNISYLPSPTAAKYVCGVLNSRLMDWVFRVTSTNNHVNIYELNNLPIPSIDDNQYLPIINEVVDKIVYKLEKGDSADADIQHLNLLVNKLYGLTYDEVLVVDPQPPFSREDYENHS